MKAWWLAPLLAASAGCALDSPTVSCSGPSDCKLPLVCCAGGLAVTSEGFSGPTCLSKDHCVAGGGTYAAFFPEGAPCGRVSGGEACAGALTCCNKTLTCETEATCAATSVPQDVLSSSEPVSCGGDNDCPEGVCCGISWTQRDGACQAVADCAAANGIVTPRPDAGVVMQDAGTGGTDDAGSAPTLADQICEAAFCTSTGSIPPNGAQRLACTQAFEAGVDVLGRSGLTPSQACLDAVRASRDLCPYVFHWRDTVVPELPTTQPILPGDCYAPGLSAPLAGAACEKLEACGKVADRAACEGWLGSLTHDMLVRITQVDGCSFDRDALGFAGRPLLGKCEVDAHCPEGTTCQTSLAPGGVCTILGCADPGPCADMGGVCEAGLCTLTCNPHITNVQARRSVKQACSARVFAEGRPADFGCARQSDVLSVCVPAVDPALCARGVEPLEGEGYGPLAGAYRCAAVQTSTLAAFSPCVVPGPSEPNPCGAGICVGSGAEGVCLNPCVATPVDTDGFMCPVDEACMDDPELGWGAMGFCRKRCDAGRGCPDGGTCERSFPASYCR